MALRAKKPEAKEKRLKMMLYGPPNVGKTIAALQFPNNYIIDTEKGTDFYAESIIKNKSAVFQSFNPDEIHDEIKKLLTEKHDFKTLTIDPITIVYLATQEKWNRIFGKHVKGADKEVQDYGMRYWGKVKSNFKAIQRLFLALDMNVIITAHQKDIYGGNFSKIGVDMDSMKGDAYLFDIVFRLEKQGDKRIATTMKERAEIGKARFPEHFEWSYSNFQKYYGKDILEKVAVPVEMASKVQCERAEHLIQTVKIEESVINKWFDKADCETWNEMDAKTIGKCITHLEKILKGATK